MNTKNLIDDEKTREYCGAGIYAIINKSNRKMYIGSSTNISKRMSMHKSSFANLTCNKKIEEDILSGNVFYSELLESVSLPCTLKELVKKEREYIKQYDSVNNGYNFYLSSIYSGYENVVAKKTQTQKKERIKQAKTQREKTDYKRKFNEEKYDRVGLYLKQGEKERWKTTAGEQGISLSEFIKRCVNEKISHDRGRQ